MKPDPIQHDRHSIRLRGYDYACAGIYFVTVCTQNHAFLFGDVVRGHVVLNSAGATINAALGRLPECIPGIVMDTAVVMPNHVHCLIALTGGFPGAGILPQRDDDISRPEHADNLFSLSDVMMRFKSFTTHLYAEKVRQGEMPPFRRRLWQRDYFEHIVRSSGSLQRFREYIKTNPERWSTDRNNPKRTGDDPLDLWLDTLGGNEDGRAQRPAPT